MLPPAQLQLPPQFPGVTFLMPFLTDDEFARLKEELRQQLASGQTRLGDSVFEQVMSKVHNVPPLKADKKWFDHRNGTDGYEIKSFQLRNKKAEPLVVGDTVANVLKRVYVPMKSADGEIRSALDIGRDIIGYLRKTLDAHAKIKKVTGRRLYSVLLRSKNNRYFAYYEEPIQFDDAETYDWQWLTDKAVVAKRNGAEVFHWYGENQRQLHYVWRVPTGALLFEIPPQRVEERVILTKSDFDARLRAEYERGFSDGRNSR